jgi:hypothetical protein
VTDEAAERLRESRGAVLLRLEHEAWCEYRATGECGCAAGMAFLDALAVDRAAERRATVERIRSAIRGPESGATMTESAAAERRRVHAVLDAETDR